MSGGISDCYGAGLWRNSKGKMELNRKIRSNVFGREIVELLRSHGAKLERSKKHKVYRFPDGRIWVVAGTPRSEQSWHNNLTDLRKFLGVAHPERKEKSTLPKHRKLGVERRVKFEELAPAKTPEWAQQLREFAEQPRPSLKPPRYTDCSPVELQRFQRTPLTVLLSKITRRIKTAVV